MSWTAIEKNDDTYRMPVPGGWLVSTSKEGYTTALCFVPDPGHQWSLKEKQVFDYLKSEAGKYVDAEHLGEGRWRYSIGGVSYVATEWSDLTPTVAPQTVEEAVNLALCMVKAEAEAPLF